MIGWMATGVQRRDEELRAGAGHGREHRRAATLQVQEAAQRRQIGRVDDVRQNVTSFSVFVFFFPFFFNHEILCKQEKKNGAVNGPVGGRGSRSGGRGSCSSGRGSCSGSNTVELYTTAHITVSSYTTLFQT